MRKKVLTIEFDDPKDINAENVYLRGYHIFISVLCVVGIIFSLPVIPTLIAGWLWVYLFDKYLFPKKQSDVKFEEMREVFDDTQKLINLRKEIGIIAKKYN